MAQSITKRIPDRFKAMVFVTIFAVMLAVMISPNLCFGAIALEGSWVTSSGGSQTVISIPTFTGNDRIAFLLVATENNISRTVDTAYLGNPSEAIIMKRVALDSTSNQVAFAEIWYATDAQITSHSVDSIYVVWLGSAGADVNQVLGTATYSGIDQTELCVDSAGNSEINSTPNPNTLTMPLSVAANDLVIGAYQNGGDATVVWNNSFNEEYDVNVASTMNGSGGTKISVGATETLSVTHTGGGRSVLVGATFRAASAGGATPLFRRRRNR